MEALTILEVISKLWPIFLGITGLIFWLAKSYSDIETLKEKVKVLFEIVNKDK